MKKWLKRIRGAISMALVWAAAWGGVGAIVGVAAASAGILVGSVVGVGGIFAALGFGAGTVFSIVLGIAEGRRRFDEMSLPRFAGWGALGGFLLALPLLLLSDPLALDWVFGISGVVALLGAGSAAGSLALARRADDRELLEHGADVADIGLTEEEKRELLAG